MTRPLSTFIIMRITESQGCLDNMSAMDLTFYSAYVGFGNYLNDPVIFNPRRLDG